MSDKPRKRWDRIEDHLRDPAYAADPQPPFTKLTGHMAWTVFRVDPDAASVLLPDGMRLSETLTGVLGAYEVVAGWPYASYLRAFGGVAVQDYDSPDTGEAVFITADIVSPHAAPAVRRHYNARCEDGDIRVCWSEGLLWGTASRDNVEWIRIGLRPTEPLQTEITGVDAYLDHTQTGVMRHLMSYVGAFAPADVVEFSISDAAPPGLRALRPTKISLGLQCFGLNATWGDPRPIDPGSVLAGQHADAGLRARGLTPAEARLAVAVGRGRPVRDAAVHLNITENTARSTLKLVYGKLGISKQSELGHLVARLESS
ncbi:MAG: hypothetical protein ABL879_09255 [Devosia sp.]